MTADPALRALLRPLFAEWEEADMTNRVGKGDKPANLHRLIVAEQAIDAALAAAEAAPPPERRERIVAALRVVYDREPTEAEVERAAKSKYWTGLRAARDDAYQAAAEAAPLADNEVEAPDPLTYSEEYRRGWYAARKLAAAEAAPDTETAPVVEESELDNDPGALASDAYYAPDTETER